MSSFSNDVDIFLLSSLLGYNISSLVDDDHILRKLQPKSIWYLTVLGSLATTQREYVALHAFRRLNLQVIDFIFIFFASSSLYILAILCSTDLFL